MALNLLILPAPLTDVASRITADVETGVMGLSQTVALAWAKIRPHLFVMRIPPLDFGVPIWIPASSQTAATAPPDPSKVSSIVVSPAKQVSYVGDRVAYHAQARDAGAAVVHGIKFNYQSLTPGTVSIDEAGRATMLAPGLATIACTAGTATGTAVVLVRPGSRPVQTDAQWRSDQGSATTSTGTGGSASLVVPPSGGVSAPPRHASDSAPSFLSSLVDKLLPTAHAQSGGGSGSAWTTNPWVIGTPRNGIIEPTRFGSVLPESFNYELSIPVVASMGNRELNIPLALYYNSQVWSSLVLAAPSLVLVLLGHTASATSGLTEQEEGWTRLHQFGFPVWLALDLGPRAYGPARREMLLFLGGINFNPSDLKLLFTRLSEENPDPLNLNISVYGDREMLRRAIHLARYPLLLDFPRTPEGRNARREYYAEQYPLKSGYYRAHYFRSASGESFLYSDDPKKEELTRVILTRSKK